ncbi:amino acid ABC transporter permease [Chakrabartyella piscis]|uniref:amino acid ABC transporter permease n=1 Tax=Chakrabartyella piscis TaxID=2918914 RepID=UPI002958849D|nr:amino acid ABC transporter permease [Chakrabartyella piscis]
MTTAELMSIVQQLASGMSASLLIFVLTLLFSMPLGLIVAFGRMSKWGIGKFKPLQLLAKIYISVLRGTPLMLQLLVVYFGPYYVFGISMPRTYRFVAVVLGFSINYAAYFAEIYRSGIESIPVGQYEAASVLGYSKSQTFFKIVFPQMIKRIIPPVTNETITLVKDTAMAFVLNYTEMFTLAKQIAAAQTTIVPLFVAGLFYFIFNGIVAIVMEKVEKRLDYYR